jgi:hypothetical protein
LGGIGRWRGASPFRCRGITFQAVDLFSQFLDLNLLSLELSLQLRRVVCCRGAVVLCEPLTRRQEREPQQYGYSSESFHDHRHRNRPIITDSLQAY